MLDAQPAIGRIGEADARIAEVHAELAREANGSRPQEIGQAQARLVVAEASLAGRGPITSGVRAWWTRAR